MIFQDFFVFIQMSYKTFLELFTMVILFSILFKRIHLNIIVGISSALFIVGFVFIWTSLEKELSQVMNALVSARIGNYIVTLVRDKFLYHAPKQSFTLVSSKASLKNLSRLALRAYFTSLFDPVKVYASYLFKVLERLCIKLETTLVSFHKKASAIFKDLRVVLTT